VAYDLDLAAIEHAADERAAEVARDVAADAGGAADDPPRYATAD